ncbi:MAG: serine/threonine-protein kinase [Bacteroidales bacterium]|nr:serine/threonine-protein kinase [Bacteroidales bacterium]
MINPSDDISSSGFIPSSEYNVSGAFSNFLELPSRGYCRLCKAQRNGQWFTLKALKPEVAHDPVYQGMFEKEFNLMMQLNHPNVVRVYSKEDIQDFGLCIVMEYVDGRTLEEFLTENPTQSVRESVARQLLEAIGYCHGKQIIHRDFKPSNVLVTYNGNRVKLIDFGLSDSDNYAVLKEPAFTKAYAAPEQLAGGEVDNRTDLYAYGLILKQLLPDRYRRVVRKCLQPKKENRYSSAEEVVEAMRSCKRRRRLMPWGMVVMASAVALSAFLLIRHSNGESTEPSQPTEVPTSSIHDTVFLAEPNKKETPLPVYEDQNSGTYVLDKPLTIVSGSVDTQAIEARRQRTDSILNAREQEKDQAQEALDNAIYNFKFTVDSMFKPVDSYVKSKEVKTSNILRGLIYIAEYKAKIRECQIRSQLPKSKRNSFFNYANDQIKVKKKSYIQKYPPIPQYPNEQQVRDPEIYQPILEQSKKYQEEGRKLHQEWERLMRSIH